MLNNSLLQFPRHGSVKIWHLGYLSYCHRVEFSGKTRDVQWTFT